MFRLKIETGNAAFDNGDAGIEIAAILRKTADRLADGTLAGTLHDYNGNRVGEFKLTMPRT